MSRRSTLWLALTLAAPALSAQESPERSLNPHVAVVLQRTPRAAAQLGFQDLLRTVLRETQEGTLPEGFPFDVKDLSELRGATLGRSYEIHTVNPEELVAGQRSLTELVHPVGIHVFFVHAGGRVVGQLEVARMGGRWEMTAAGFAPLAQEIHAVASQEPRFRFVRIYQATSDLVEVGGASGEGRFVPLASARHSLRLAAATSEAPLAARPESDLFGALRASVKANLSLVQ